MITAKTERVLLLIADQGLGIVLWDKTNTNGAPALNKVTNHSLIPVSSFKYLTTANTNLGYMKAPNAERTHSVKTQVDDKRP